MHRFRFRVRFLLLLLVLPGCVSLAQPAPYQPWRVQIGAGADTAVAATAAALEAAGFGSPDVAAGILTAVTPPSRGVRDHAVVAILATGDLTVDVRTEIASDGGWLRPDQTCAGYGYMREKRLAALILEKLHSME